MKLHGYFRSSAAWRVRIALNLKGLDVEHVSHHLRHGGQRDPAYLALNPHMWNGPRCKDAFQSISPHEDGAVICPACLCGHNRWPR